MTWKIFKHLAPRGLFWRIPYATKIYNFFKGLGTAVIDDPIEEADKAYLDVFPETTRELDAWDEQFGLIGNTTLSDSDRRERLEGAWRAQGGQTVAYIESVLQAAGFPLYVHGWWNPIGGALRDPTTILPALVDYTMLVNKMYEVDVHYYCEAGEPLAEAGEPRAEAGDNAGAIFNRIVYPIPVDTSSWYHVLYIGSQTFLSSVNIPEDRKDELEDLVLKLCPGQKWVALCANYV